MKSSAFGALGSLAAGTAIKFAGGNQAAALSAAGGNAVCRSGGAAHQMGGIVKTTDDGSAACVRVDVRTITMIQRQTGLTAV
jgi:hypothetical protein